MQLPCQNTLIGKDRYERVYIDTQKVIQSSVSLFVYQISVFFMLFYKIWLIFKGYFKLP
jgi:hypothetical protein